MRRAVAEKSLKENADLLAMKSETKKSSNSESSSAEDFSSAPASPVDYKKGTRKDTSRCLLIQKERA
jgi:hypothetical protein